MASAELLAAAQAYAAQSELDDRLKAAQRLQRLVLACESTALKSGLAKCSGDPVVRLGTAWREGMLRSHV